VRIAAERIRKLEVQGARNVAIAAITAMETLANQTRTKTKKEFLKELVKAKETLFVSRETEPLMRNAVRLIINQVEKSAEKNVRKLSGTVSKASQQFLKDLENSKDRIAEMGARRIRDNSDIDPLPLFHGYLSAEEGQG